MRPLGLLLRAAARCSAADPVLLSVEACGSGTPAAAPLRAVSQLTSLLGFQLQQQAGYAAARRRDDDDDEEELAAAGGRRHLSHSKRRQLIDRKLYAPKYEDEEGDDAAQQRIRGLLRKMGRSGEDDSASKFVSSFFGSEERKDLRYKGEGGRYATPTTPLATAGEEGEDEEGAALAGSDDELDADLSDAELDEEELAGLQVSLPDQLSRGEEFNLMRQLQGLRPGSRRIVLTKLLEGGIMRADPQAMREWEEIQAQTKPPEDFRMKVVDVNRTSKGTRTGGLYRYSCMVVVGNGNGVLGWGQGKAAEVNDAVQKAYQRACRNLYPVPRFNDHTIPEATHSKYGQVKVTMYPKASGNGIVANPLMTEICKMAGIHDIGIKVHGSRNVRNAVKCVFKAFDQMRTEEELMGEDEPGKLVFKMPPGRFNKLRL